MTNLLDNAVKWSPPDGIIRVQLEGDRLRVADQGPGIADADLPFIFDRFYRGPILRGRPRELGLVCRSSRKQRPSMVAGSRPVARLRAVRSSLSSCRARPASRRSPRRRHNLLVASPTRPTPHCHLLQYHQHPPPRHVPDHPSPKVVARGKPEPDSALSYLTTFGKS